MDEHRKFLVPIKRIRLFGEDENEFTTDLAKEQIKSMPDDETHVSDEKSWDAYRDRCGKELERGPVLHKEGSTHMIIPDPSELPATGDRLAAEEQFEPQRLAGKFSDPTPQFGQDQGAPCGCGSL